MTTAAGQLASNTVSVVVKPELTVQAAPLHTRTGAPVVVTATVHPANAATEVLLTQSESKGARKWKVVGTGKVRSGVAVIRWTAPSGQSVVRVELRKAQLTSGYEEQTSRAVVLNATNAASLLHVEAVSSAHASKSGHASKTVSKFVPTKLKAKNGRITIEMTNATSVKRGIALRGNGVDAIGSVVGNGGVSSVTAVLKPGTYEYFDPVARHAQEGMRGKLIVS